MKDLIIIVFVFLTITSCKVKISSETEKSIKGNQVNTELKEKLEHILMLDQGIRKLLQENLSGKEKDEITKRLGMPKKSNERDISLFMIKIDSINLIEVEKIIKEFGYPKKELVGEPANEAIFYVIQHSDKIEQYLPIIKKAAENGDIPMKKLAMMEDRYLMHKGKEQIYGTQIRGQKDKNGEWVYFVWPIKNPDSVNIIREKIGLGTIEEYVKNFNIEYKVVTLKEINEL